MSINAPSDPREVQGFQFKLACRLRVHDQKDEEYKGSYSLVAPANKYGLVFVGCRNKIQAILLPHVLEMEQPTEQKSSRGASHGGVEIADYPRRELLLSDTVTNLALSCDQSLLAVAISKGGCAHALIYDVASFHGKNINLVKEVRLSTSPEAYLLELSWNPGIANILASCLSNGTVAVYEFKNGGVDINSLPPDAQSTCFSWSPKGKQLVVGAMNGTLTQYKPDLKAMKSICAPAVFEGPASVVNVLWISNYQFAAVYRNSINESERPSLLIVNAPKGGGVNFVNYEDICYSSGDLRRPQFYLMHQPNWNILVVGSANSMEVGVLGLAGDQLTWEQWLQEDASRAELPLTTSKEETFPLGLGFDTCTQKQLPWSENQFLPPMPVLILLSHRGVLCLFYAINILPGAATICSPPERLPDENGLLHFTTSSLGDVVSHAGPKEDIKSPQALLGTPMPSKPLEWATPSGIVDINRMGLRVNLTEKFENISPPQPVSVAKPAFSFIPTDPAKESIESVLGTDLKFNAKPSSVMGSGSFFSALEIQQHHQQQPQQPQQQQQLEHQQQLLLLQQQQQRVLLPSSGNQTIATILNTPGPANLTLNLGGPGATSTPNMHEVKPVQLQQQQIESQKREQGLQNLQQQHFRPHIFQPHSQPQLLQQQHLLLQRSALVQQSENSAPASKQPSNLFGSIGDTNVVPNTGTFHSAPGELNKDVSGVSGSGDKLADGERTKHAKEIINSSVLYRAIQDEMSHFEKEISELKARLQKINMEVGTPEEQKQLCSKVQAMDSFCLELQETTCIHSSEVRALKTEMVESLAWVEDARSRAVQENDPCWLRVVRSQELDPVSARYLSTVKQLSYYVETQLSQADRSLELQWANFQESCRDKIKGRLYIPSLEAVYQAMVLQSNILLKQKANVKQIVDRTAKHKRAKSGSLSVLGTSVTRAQTNSDTDLAALAANLLQMRLGATGTSVVGENISDIMAAGRYSMVASAAQKLTPNKQATLRDFLTQSSVRHIRPIKPSNNSLKHLSILEKHSKSQDIKARISTSAEMTPLGSLDKMVSQMGSEKMNGSKVLPSSLPPEKSLLNVGVALKEGVALKDSALAAGEPAGDLFGHIAKSMVTKFKEPDSSSTVAFSSAPASGENLKTHSIVADVPTSVSAVNSKQNVSFSFATPLQSASSVPLSKSKGTASFSFGSSPGQFASQIGDVLSKGGGGGTSFMFQMPATVPATTATPVFGGNSSKPSSFTLFAPTTTTITTTATSSTPVQFFGSESTETSTSAVVATTANTSATFSFGSLSVSTTTAPISVSTPSVFGDKTAFGQVSLVNTSTSQAAKTSQTPSIFGGSNLSTSSPSFTFSVSSSLPGQITPGSVKPIFGGAQSKPSVDIASPDSGNQPNKGTIPNFSNLLNPSSATSANLITAPTSNTAGFTAAVTSSTSASSVFSSATKQSSAVDFSLGQLSSALSITPIIPGGETSKEDSVSEKPVNLSVDVAALRTSQPVSAVAPAVSAPTKPFSFSVPSMSPASTAMGGKVNTLEESDKSTQVSKAAASAPITFFGQPVCSPTSFSQNTGNIFGQKSATIFGGGTATAAGAFDDKSITGTVGTLAATTAASPETAVSTTVTTIETLTETTSSVTNSTIFGGSVLATSLSNSAAATISATTTTAVTGNSTTSGLFSNTTNTAPVFGNTTAAVAATTETTTTDTTTGTTTEAAAAATTTTTATTNTSASATGVSTTSSLFGGTATTSSLGFGSGTSSFFGQAGAAGSSVFKPQGGPPAASVFGQTTTSPSSVFGQAVSSTAPIFGQASVTTSASIFGQPATSTTTSVFGQQTASTAAPAFGQQAAVTTAPVFGQSSTTTTSVFGQPTSTSSVFGQAAVTSTTSLFGQPVATTAAPAFGQPAATTAASVFGQPAASTTVSVFGQPAATTSASMFGTGSTASSIFGQAASTSPTNVFGQPATTPTPVFGGSNAFGQPASSGSFMGGGTQPAFGNTPAFGQSGGSIFGQSSGTGFGSSGGSVFGGGAAFGKSGNLFQPSSGGNLFGGSPTSGGGSGGAFSAAQGQSIAESGFGSPSGFGQNKPGGFGSPPAFGQPAAGSSAFGGSPTFGGAPTFGGSPIFGSPNRVFGSTSPQSAGAISPAPSSAVGIFGGTGGSQQQSNTFESLANQNTMTFGNLATSQQSPSFGSSGGSLFGGTSQPQPPAFQNTTSFGGSSFSSWR